MRDQYFGDRKDYVKFDLMLTICEQTGIQRFSYIPMLSPNDTTANGSETNYQFIRRRELYDFLQKHVREGRRQVFYLREFMREQAKPLYSPYRDEPYLDGEECRHSGNSRVNYFRHIPPDLLNAALIFLDPDTGIEVNHMRFEHEYVLYHDLKGLCERMSEDSILAIFQWAQYRCTHARFEKIAEEVLRRCPSDTCVSWIARCPVGYVFVFKNPDSQARTVSVLAGHHDRWQKDFIVGSLSRTIGHPMVSENRASSSVHRTRASSSSRSHTVHTDEGKETDADKAKGRKPKDQWEQRPDPSYTIQCQLCGKWLKSGLDAHVRGRQHGFSYKAYRDVFRL